MTQEYRVPQTHLLWPIWRGPYYMLQNVHAQTFIALRAIIILRLHQSP